MYAYESYKKITKNVNNWVVFMRFVAVMSNTFTHEPTNIVSHHVFIKHSLVVALKIQYFLVEVLALLLWETMFLNFIKMSIKDMNFQSNPVAHDPVITQEALNLCDKVVTNFFLLNIFGNSVNFIIIIFICVLMKTPALTSVIQDFFLKLSVTKLSQGSFLFLLGFFQKFCELCYRLYL